MGVRRGLAVLTVLLAAGLAAASQEDFVRWEAQARAVLESRETAAEGEFLRSLQSLQKESKAWYRANRLGFLEAALLESAGESEEAAVLYKRLSDDEAFGAHAARSRLRLLRRMGREESWRDEAWEFLQRRAADAYVDEVALDLARAFSAEDSPHSAASHLRRMAKFPGLSRKTRREIERRLFVMQMGGLSSTEVSKTLLALLRENVSDDDAVAAARAVDEGRPEVLAGEEEGFLAAKALFENRDFERASGLLAGWRESFPESSFRPEALFLLARGLEQRKLYAEADALFAGIQAEPFWGPRACYRRMAMKDGAGDAEGALALADERLRVHPSGAFLEDTLYLQSRILLRLGRHEAALAALRRIPAGGTLRLYERGVIECALERYRAGAREEAARLLEEVLRRSPVNSYAEEAHFWLGRIARQEGDPHAARQHFRAVLSANPSGYFADLIVLHEAELWPAGDGASPPALDEASGRAAFEAARRLRTAAPEKPSAPAPRPLPLVTHPVDGQALATPVQRARYLDALGRGDWAAAEWRAALDRGGLTLDEMLEGAAAAYRAGDYLLTVHLGERALAKAASQNLPLYDVRLRQALYPIPFPVLLLREACRCEVDPLLVASVMREESRFDPRAKSWAAARGLMQFIPSTARSVAQLLGVAWTGEDSLYDPDTAIRLGANHLRDLLARFGGDAHKAVAGYNAGETAVRRWLRETPQDDPAEFLARISFMETRNYVKRVLNSYMQYRAIYGDGLCARP